MALFRKTNTERVDAMQNKKQTSGAVAGVLLPMGLVCVFAVCSLALAILGGRAYKAIQASANDGVNSTIAANYLRTKLAGADAEGVQLREENGTQLLAIVNEVDGVSYETRIYQHQDALMESTETGGQPFEPAGGMTIARVQSCVFTLDADGLFTAEITSLEGTVTRTSFAVAKGGCL